jgi:hypothetical protein
VTAARIRTALGVAGSVLVIGFSGWLALSSLAGPADPAADPSDAAAAAADWAAYPGTAWADADVVAGAPGLEATIAASDAMTAEIRAAVSAEYDVTWWQFGGSEPDVQQNGYGRDSLLQNWYAPQWRGDIEATDAGARERILAIVERVAGRYDAEAFSVSNEREIPAADAVEYYGAAEPDDQPYWASSVSGGPHPSYSLLAEVYDNSLPADGGYIGWRPYDQDGDRVDPSTPMISIALLASGIGLLPEDDSAEFAERLAPYAGLVKPQGEY